ncbi:MAG: H+transporting two-sector ATPase subunit [Myxococcales bacterium]|nr:H+transporting two-sector ATPase subunit [Myxococcales bacterium]
MSTKQVLLAIALLGGTAYAQPSPDTTGPSPDHGAAPAAAPSPDNVGASPDTAAPPPEKVGPPPEKVDSIPGKPPGPDPSAVPLTPERERKAALAESAGGEPGEHAEEDPDPTRHFNFTNFSYRGKDEYGGPFGDGVEIDPQGRKLEEEPMSAPFILMLVNFGILLIILGKYGGPVASKLARDRHDQIKTALDEAASLRKQAADKLAEYEKRIKDVDLEVKKLIDGIRADAESDKARILANADVQAALLKREAEQRIAAEIELARAQLKKEVTAAASAATEKLLREKVNQDDQTRLVSTFIAGISGDAKEGR